MVFRLPKYFTLIAAAALLSITPMIAHADYNALTDFNYGPGPQSSNAAWTYGYRSTVEDSSLNLFDAIVYPKDKLTAWTSTVGSEKTFNTPLVGYQASSNPFDADYILMHPGNNADNSVDVIRWTASADDVGKSFLVTADFLPMDASGTGTNTNASLLFDGKILGNGSVNAGSGTGFEDTYLIDITRAGDTVEWAVNGSWPYGSTGLTSAMLINYDPIPEPGFVAMGILSLGGLLVLRRRR